MTGVISLQFYQVAASYLFVLILLAIIRRRKIRRETEILIASLRMTIQLILTGYILVLVFDNPHPLITLAYLMVMVGFAIHTIFRRFRGQLSPALKRVIFLAIGSGSLITIFYFLLVVIQVKPWYNPQYFIPIAGMITGNSMTGISLGIKALNDGMNREKPLIEEALCLGATPGVAARSVVNSAFESAILPTIQTMLGMGIVSLPGMMTGQILSGTVPVTAVAYQIAIMMAITGAVSLSVITLLLLGSRTFFNDHMQLIDRPGQTS
jgi:putative ABC transport system permease protein